MTYGDVASSDVELVTKASYNAHHKCASRCWNVRSRLVMANWTPHGAVDHNEWLNGWLVTDRRLQCTTSDQPTSEWLTVCRQFVRHQSTDVATWRIVIIVMRLAHNIALPKSFNARASAGTRVLSHTHARAPHATGCTYRTLYHLSWLTSVRSVLAMRIVRDQHPSRRFTSICCKMH